MIHQEPPLGKLGLALLAVVVVVSLDVFVQLKCRGELKLTLRTFVFLALSLAWLLRGMLARLSHTGGQVLIFVSVLTEPFTRLTVAEIDLLVTELLLTAETADRQVVAGEVSVRGEGGVTVDTAGVDGGHQVSLGVVDLQVSVPGLRPGSVLTSSQTVEGLRPLSKV